MIVTAEWIEQNKTTQGAWTAKQLRCLGIGWPPEKGWKLAAEGRHISDAARTIFEAGSAPKENGAVLEITREWLDSTGDENGLTPGQRKLLDIWCKGAPYVGKTVPENVARFVEKCRGYRGMSAEVQNMLGR